MNDKPAFPLPSDRTSRALRDRFLNARDADDYAALRLLSADLRNCADILPRSVCVSLGLPRGSTYAIAAMTIVAS
jgi:hypothetical protein